MGLGNWLYHHHHEKHHHTNRVDGFTTADGHSKSIESTHCDKRNAYRDSTHGVEAEPGNPSHGIRTDAVSEFHPHPPAVPGPVVVVGPVVHGHHRPPVVHGHHLPPVVTTVVERHCPTAVVSFGPWRTVSVDCPTDRGPVVDRDQHDNGGSFYRP